MSVLDFKKKSIFFFFVFFLFTVCSLLFTDKILAQYVCGNGICEGGWEDYLSCPEDCPAPPGSPYPSGSPLPSVSPGGVYLYCGHACCPGEAPPCNPPYYGYDWYCYPSCDSNGAAICYRDPECYQPCDDCRICGCLSDPIGDVPSCPEGASGETRCDSNTGQCYSTCNDPDDPNAPVPTPTPTPAPPGNIAPEVSYSDPRDGTLYLNQAIDFTTRFKDSSINSADDYNQPEISLALNGSFENGTSRWSKSPAVTWNIASGNHFGASLLKISRNSGDDAYVVSDWITVGSLNNRSFTLSFDINSPDGNYSIDGMGIQTNSFYADDCDTIATTPYWKRKICHLSFNRPSDTQIRVVLRPSSDFGVDPPDFYFDGVMVEEGTTQGVFTDINTVQFNLEKDTDHNNLLLNNSFESGNTSNWGHNGSPSLTVVNSPSQSKAGSYYLRAVSAVDDDSINQDIDITGTGTGTQYTFSFWAKSNSGSLSASVGFWSWDGGSDWNPSFEEVTITAGDWQQFVAHYSLPDGSRVLLRPEIYLSAPGGEYWLDAFLVEQGNTDGFYMDRDTWPLRIAFNSQTGFLIKEANQDWEGPYTAAYNSTYGVWALGSDIAVTGATLLGLDGGVPQTYAFLNNDVMTIHWLLQLDDDFPSGDYELGTDPWNTTLFVRDYTSLDDSSALDGNDTILMLGGWDYHRLGALNIEEQGFATIQGNIYNSTNISSNCNQNAYSGGGTVNISQGGSGYNHTIPLAGSNSYSDADVPALENTQVTFNFPASWECNTDCSWPGGAATCAGSQAFYTLSPSPSQTYVRNFYVWQPPDRENWWQAVSGSIHADNSISSNIPNTCTLPLCNPLLISGSNYGVVSQGLDSQPDVGEGDISPGDWWARDTSYQGKEYNYTWWSWHFRNQDKETYGGGALPNPHNAGADPDNAVIYQSSGTINNMSGSISADSKIIILHDGNLTISDNLTVAEGGFLMVIASGNITVGYNATEVQGIFIADGDIVFNSNPSTDDVLLQAQGTFISWGDIDIARDLGGLNNAFSPAASFTYRPDFVLNAPQPIKEIFYTWKQVPG